MDLAAELGDPLDKTQFAARRRASKAKEKELQFQQEMQQQQQQQMGGPSSYGRPPMGPNGPMAPPYPPNSDQGWIHPSSYPQPPRQPIPDTQYYRPGANSHQSPLTTRTTAQGRPPLGPFSLRLASFLQAVPPISAASPIIGHWLPRMGVTSVRAILRRPWALL